MGRITLCSKNKIVVGQETAERHLTVFRLSASRHLHALQLRGFRARRMKTAMNDVP